MEGLGHDASCQQYATKYVAEYGDHSHRTPTDQRTPWLLEVRLSPWRNKPVCSRRGPAQTSIGALQRHQLPARVQEVLRRPQEQPETLHHEASYIST